MEGKSRIRFKAEIEENNIYLAGSLAYLSIILYAVIKQEVKVYPEGLFLLLTALMLIYHIRNKRRDILRECKE